MRHTIYKRLGKHMNLKGNKMKFRKLKLGNLGNQIYHSSLHASCEFQVILTQNDYRPFSASPTFTAASFELN